MLIPKMLYKGGIFNHWGKKQAVALQRTFFEQLPEMPTTSRAKADIAWFLYDLVYSEERQRYDLILVETIYTDFNQALNSVITPEPGSISDFVETLQEKLDSKLKSSPDAPSLQDLLSDK